MYLDQVFVEEICEFLPFKIENYTNIGIFRFLKKDFRCTLEPKSAQKSMNVLSTINSYVENVSH